MDKTKAIVNEEEKLRRALGEELIPDAEIRDDLHICEMTQARWDSDPAMAALGWPPPIRINRRKFRQGPAYRQFKANLVAKAARERAAKTRAELEAPAT